MNAADDFEETTLQTPLPSRWDRVSGFWLLIALLMLVAGGKVIQGDSMDPDAFWHLRVADQLLQDGIRPLVDRISFESLKTPWTPYSWLAELGMRAVWDHGGYRAAMLVTAMCSAGIVGFIALGSRIRVSSTNEAKPRLDFPPLEGGIKGGVLDHDDACGSSIPPTPPSPSRGEGESRNDVAVALCAAVGAFFSLPFISFRPVAFALVIFGAIVALILRDRRQPTRWLWLCVPLTLLETNLHLYSVICVAFAGVNAIGSFFDNRRNAPRRTLVAIAMLIAACGTPMLPGAITTALRYNAVDPMVASNFITEMRPFYSGGLGHVSLGFVIAMLALCVWKRRSLTITDWLWLALGLMLLFRLGRFSPVFALIAIPIVACAMPPLGGTALRKPLIKAALLIVLFAGGISVASAYPWHTSFDKWLNRNGPTYPTAAADFVDQHITPSEHRLINEFNWGGYLAWRLGDRYQVLMDGRTQLYAPAFWYQTHLGNTAARTAFLTTVRADAAILPTHDSAFEAVLIQLNWTIAYRDDLAVVFVPPADPPKGNP